MLVPDTSDLIRAAKLIGAEGEVTRHHPGRLARSKLSIIHQAGGRQVVPIGMGMVSKTNIGRNAHIVTRKPSILHVVFDWIGSDISSSCQFLASIKWCIENPARLNTRNHHVCWSLMGGGIIYTVPTGLKSIGSVPDLWCTARFKCMQQAQPMAWRRDTGLVLEMSTCIQPPVVTSTWTHTRLMNDVLNGIILLCLRSD